MKINTWIIVTILVLVISFFGNSTYDKYKEERKQHKEIIDRIEKERDSLREKINKRNLKIKNLDSLNNHLDSIIAVNNDQIKALREKLISDREKVVGYSDDELQYMFDEYISKNVGIETRTEPVVKLTRKGAEIIWGDIIDNEYYRNKITLLDSTNTVLVMQNQNLKTSLDESQKNNKDLERVAFTYKEEAELQKSSLEKSEKSNKRLKKENTVLKIVAIILLGKMIIQ